MFRIFPLHHHHSGRASSSAAKGTRIPSDAAGVHSTPEYKFRQYWGGKSRYVRIEAASLAEAKKLNEEAKGHFVRQRIHSKVVERVNEPKRERPRCIKAASAAAAVAGESKLSKLSTFMHDHALSSSLTYCVYYSAR